MLRCYQNVLITSHKLARKSHLMASVSRVSRPSWYRSLSSGLDGDVGSDIVTQTGDNAPKLDNIIVVPLAKKPLFPLLTANIVVKDETVANALIQTISQNGNGGYVGLFYRKDKQTHVPADTTAGEQISPNLDIVTAEDDVHHVGTFAQITSYTKRDIPTILGGATVPAHYEFIVVTHRRITINEFLSFSTLSPGATSTSPHSVNGIATANVFHWPKNSLTDSQTETQLAKAYVNEIILTIREWLSINPLGGEQIRNFFISHVMIT
jgi:ATP-dependent Lon protease